MRAYLGFPGCLGWRPLDSSSRAPRAWLLVPLVLALLFAAPAGAQDDQARARALFAEGVGAFDRGAYQEALEAFEGAYRLAPHPAVRVNMANCFEQLGRFVEARFNYERFLEESGAAIDPQQRGEIEGAIASLAGKIGKLVVVLEPSDATLTVDGQPAQRAFDGSLELPAGMHSFRATKPGYMSSERLIQVEAASERRISLQLVPEDRVAPPPEPLAVSPTELPAANDSPQTPSAAPSRLRPAVWIALGSALVFGAGAGIAGGLAWKAQKDFDAAVADSNNPMLTPIERTQARSEGLDAADRADVLATVTDVLLAGAAVSAGTAFVLWLVDRKASPDVRPISFAPSLGNHGDAHAVLKGAF